MIAGRVTAGKSREITAESCAEEQLNNPNIADEVLIKETSVGHTWDEVIPHDGATSIRSPLTDRNIALNATIMNTKIKMARLPSVVFMIDPKNVS
jgi:hypothetical protein